MHRLSRIVLLLLVCSVFVGCGAMSRSSSDVVEVKAEYLELNNKSVAVLVSMSDHIAFNFPDARSILTGEITRLIKTNVPGVTVTAPEQTLAWQDTNAYWATRPPSMIIRQLNVDRVVLVEVGEYRTHEPGDKHVMRGVITASVNIVEAEAADPDNFGASFTKNAMYPRPGESVVGRVGEGQAKVELATQMRFSEAVAGLFFDHMTVR